MCVQRDRQLTQTIHNPLFIENTLALEKTHSFTSSSVVGFNGPVTRKTCRRLRSHPCVSLAA